MSQPLYFEYTPEPGDTLHSVILRLYDAAPWSRRCEELRQLILVMNPHIKNPDRLEPGVVLRLTDFTDSVALPGLAHQHFLSATPEAEDRRRLWAMAWAEHSGLLTNPGGVALGTGANLLSNGNLELLRQIGDEYAAYKKGQMTKGQYDYRRRLLIERFRGNAGPFESFMFRGLRTRQAIRIARQGGVPYDHNIRQNVGRLRQLGSLASKGGVVLTGVGVTAACLQIADTVDRKEKNEIFVDTVFSTLVGAGAGYAIGAFLVSNPVGWGVALVLAVGTAVGTWGAGKAASVAYDKWGNEVDLVNGLGVDRICSS